jgi:flagellar hook assembly protein FlgD
VPRFVRAFPAALLAAFVVLPTFALAPVAGATLADPKVVVIVGPVGSYNAHYKADADAVAAEAKKYTPNVVKVYTPNATWARVKAAVQGANIVVYLGHGNGWPSIYTPWQPYTKDGFGLDPDTGADGTKHTYYGEYYIGRDIRLAPNAVVLFYHLCYASGNTEPGLSTGTFTQSKQRVDNYGAGFLAAGARAVLADGHPYHPTVDYIRQLFTTRRTVDQIFHADPDYNGHVFGPYASARTPGLQYELDPDIGGSAPSGFYRSVVGQLSLTTTQITGARWAPTDEDPSDFVVPGAAEVTGSSGVPLFDSNAAADDPAGPASATLAVSTRLRLTALGTPMADGTRVFAAQELDGSPKGWVRATGLTARDSLATKIWTLDRPAALISPNGDGNADSFSLGVRFSESVPARLLVKNAAGATVLSTTKTGDVLRFDWDLTNAGSRVPDGAYSWNLSGADGWGNAGASATGTFSVDGTDPTTTVAVAGTAGSAGWLRSAATVTLTPHDATSGVASTTYSLDGGATSTYTMPLTVATQGAHTITFRSTDVARNVETTRTKTFSVDSVAPTISAAFTGTAGDAAGWYRSTVSVDLAASDATSGLASTTWSLDGSDPATLPATVAIDADGTHSLEVVATDVAGNVTKNTSAIVVDTVAPTLSVPASSSGTAGTTFPTFSPNGDGYRDTYRQPFSLTEAATVTAAVRNATGGTVRTLTVAGVAGANGVVWNGRTSSGAIAPDGRYQIDLVARDKAGNVSVHADGTVDVYGALTAVQRVPVKFFPQDGDSIRPSSTLTFRLLRPASVTVRAIAANGTVVRTRYTAKALAAGTYTWTWDGRRSDGTYVAQGAYRFEVYATNGQGSERQTESVYVGAFQVTTSAATATRGKTLTVTAVSSESLGANPRLYVSQPGLTTWSVAMGHVTSLTYRTTIRLKTGGTAGTLHLYVVGTDTHGGRNRSTTLGMKLL